MTCRELAHEADQETASDRGGWPDPERRSVLLVLRLRCNLARRGAPERHQRRGFGVRRSCQRLAPVNSRRSSWRGLRSCQGVRSFGAPAGVRLVGCPGEAHGSEGRR